MSKRASHLLIHEPPLQVLPSLAKEIGLNEAIVLQQIHYWLGRSNHDHKGKKWVHKTYEEWASEFPFWSISTIKRVIYKLEGSEMVISSEEFNRYPTDRTKWYTINYDKLPRPSQSDTLEGVKMERCRAVQNDTLLHYTENTTENTPEKGRPEIFSVYEQNIGVMTPMIKDKLLDIEKTYPAGWFTEAVQIAVENNARKLSYVEAIMGRWKTEGKDNGHKKGRQSLRFQAVKMLSGTEYTEEDIERTIETLKGAA